MNKKETELTPALTLPLGPAEENQGGGARVVSLNI